MGIVHIHSLFIMPYTFADNTDFETTVGHQSLLKQIIVRPIADVLIAAYTNIHNRKYMDDAHTAG